ncbi:MAG: hypothetical protein LQ345_002913 [Seirophora villosa]|nr:MAG: hypothetical protein LQ345_002913 [Seirophora villosa]
MEHLPLPTQPPMQTTPIFPAIPYLCRYEYDEGSFLEYPHRSGLPKFEVEERPFSLALLSSNSQRVLVEMPPAELEPFLQNWLFFGLLHEVLQDIYRHEDFVIISIDNGVEKSIITTAKLSSRLEEFEVKVKKQDETSIQAVYKHIARCLNLTCACLFVEFATFDNDLKFHLASVSELIGTCRSATSSKVPHHVSDSCGCKLLQIDEKLLVDCLEKACLPLLRIRGETDLDEMTVEVIASTDSTCYVALSHVWADGLGNPKATALPRCQLSRLKSLVDNLDFDYLPRTAASELPKNASEMLLWCDSLCCPVQDKEAKKMALQQMYRTYESASVVLVLDKGLTSHREGRDSVIQQCLRVATSRWMTRLWTLQEGALPAKKTDYGSSSPRLPYRYVYCVIEGIFKRLTTFTNIESHGARFRDVSRGLLYRSVTVPSDEPLLIATLMALDLSRILVCKPRKRMIILWRMIATAPSGVNKDILFHTVPKLKRRGFRWAPRSLLFADFLFTIARANEPGDRAVLAKVDNEKGLVAKLAGLRIRTLVQREHRRDHTFDPPPDLEKLYASISRLKNPWILYIGSSSMSVETAHRALLTDATSEKKQQSPHDEPLCVKIIEQVFLLPVSSDMNKMCRAAHLLAHRDLAPSAAARAVDELVTAGVEPDSPVLQEAVRGLDLEIERLSRSPAAVDELAANGIPSVDESGYTLLRELIVSMYRGHYLQVEDDAPSDRKWCID